MSTFMHAEPRRSYSWWWGSHISPKNSKWLQENLTDMDLKVKAMIKLIEEDADSFARRAEMFYKKRPELIKYVEDIYRAYRALSERYDHATGALRHAHRTIAETFPNHIPLALPDESPSISPSTEMVLCTPETPSSLHLFNPDDLQKGALGGPEYFHIDNENVPYADQNDLFEAKKGLKQLKELFAPRELTNRVKFHEGKARKGLIFQEEEECVSESQLSIQEKENANIEIERLQEEVSLLSIENQKLKIQIKSQSMSLDSSRTESQMLRDAITKLESEMDAAFLKNQLSCERIFGLESEVLKAKYEFEKLHEETMMEIVKLCSAEEQCRSLMKENQNLKFEFEQSKDVLEEVRELSVEKHDLMKRAIKEKEDADNETKRFHKQLSLVSNDNKSLEIQVLSVMKLLENSRAEVQNMRIAKSKLESEKEAAILMGQLAWRSLSSLETDNFEAKEEMGKLHAEILLGIIMLCSAEEKHFALETSNERLKLEHEVRKRVLEEIQMLSVESQHLLEQEVNEKVIIKNEIEFLQVEVSQLTVDNQNMKSQIASMSKHLDAYRAEVQHLSNAVSILEGEKEDTLFKNQLSAESLTSLEGEVFTANEEILKLHEEVLIGIVKLCSIEEQYLSLRSTRHCLNLEIEEQKTMLEDLIISLQESDKQLVEAKKSFQSLERQYSLSQENVRHMNLEFQTQLEKFQDIEHSKIGLEEKVHQLEDINYSLNEHIIIYDSKLKLLQDEIVFLKETNNKVEDEIKINLVNNRLLQQELDSVKDDRYELNLKHKSLIEQMEVASLNMESLEILIKELQFGCTELKDGCKKLEDEKLVFFNKLQDMEAISERNAVLQNALSDAVDKIRALENSCESLTAKDSTHAVEMAASLSQMKAIFDNLQRLSDKNSILENFLADANTELEGLRLKLNESEESNQFLSNQNSNLLLQRNALISQVESFHCSLKNLETKYAMLDTSYLNLKEEKDILVAQVMELDDALKFQKKDQESLIQSSKLCLFSLENQIHLLQEDGRFKEEELDTAHQEIMSNMIEILVLQRCLCDMKDSFNAEKLKHECLIQSSNIHLSSLENQINLMQEKGRVRDEKLEEQQHKYLSAKLEIFILQKCLSEMEKKNFVRFQECQKLAEASRCAGELICQLEASKLLLEEESTLLLDHKAKVKDGIDLLLESLDINKKMNIDGSEDAFLQIILRDVKNLLACISDANEYNLLLHIELSVYLIFLKQNTLEKVLLGQELERTEGKLLFFQRDRDQLFEGCEKLCQEIDDKDHTNKLLEIELDSLRRLLSSLLKEFSNLKDEKSALEDENNALLNEAMNLEHLCLFYRSANAEIFQHFEEENNVIIGSLVATKNAHMSYIKKSEEKLKAVEDENKSLKNLHVLWEDLRGRTTLLEFDLVTTKNFCEEQIFQIEVGKNLLRKKSMELDAANHEVDKTNIAKMQFEEKISVLLEGHACKDAQIINIYEENRMLNVELNRFNGMIEVLGEREHNLSSELQKKICEADEYEEEITNLLNGIQVSVVIGMILEDKMLEWAITYERLRICSLVQWEMLIKEITLRNSHEFILQKKLHDLEKENTELKAKWNSCLPLFSSLENGIATVDNQVHQLAYLQNYQVISLADRLEDKSNNQTNKGDLGTISGAMELQNLLSKLEAIEKLLLHTNNQLKQEKHLQAFENLEPLKRGIEGLKLETSDRQAAQSEEPSIVKNGQLMKDIELDQISSSNIVSRIQSAESEDQMLKLWETAEKDCSTERAHDFKIGIDSEKEVGVDKQEISVEIKESREEWSKEVIEGLSAGAERLSVLKVTCLKLSLKVDRFGKSKRLKCSEPITIQTKLKQAKEEILSLADIVSKLRKRVEEYLKPFEKMARLDREQVWEQMVMILDRIEKLEKEMAEMKLQGARTFRVLLWDYILGWRVKQGRKKRGHLCGCIRPKTQE